MSEPIHITRPIMGGTFCVSFWTNRANHYEALVKEGLDLIADLENKLTDFKDSPFNLINEKAGEASVSVDEETFNLIKRGVDFSRETNGAFDLSYATVGALWREARKTGIMPDQTLLNERRALVDYTKIQLDEKDHSVFLPIKNMRIGLGGIGKGYAVDKLYEFLLSKGMVNFMVDGSGDVRVHSQASAPRPWRLGIKNPFSPNEQKKIGYVAIKDGALATSGDYVNYIRRSDLERKYHHVIDPKTGLPTEGIVSSSVLAPTALEADLNATVLMVMGVTKALEWLKLKQLAAFMVKSDGTVVMSEKAMQLMKGTLS